MSRKGSIALLVVSFMALAIGVYSGIQTSTYTRCQARWNDQAANATRERAKAADQDRATDRAESQATSTLILSVFAAKTPAEARAAFAQYEEKLRALDAARADAERQRAENPIPPLPSETCG